MSALITGAIRSAELNTFRRIRPSNFHIFSIFHLFFEEHHGKAQFASLWWLVNVVTPKCLLGIVFGMLYAIYSHLQIMLYVFIHELWC